MKWFGYVWMFLLGVPYISWTIRSFREIPAAIKNKRITEEAMADITIWIILNAVLVFLLSLVYFVWTFR